MNQPESTQSSRRQFLKTSSAAVSGALAAPLLFNSPGRAASSSDTLRVGLVGCGGRGNGAISNAMSSDSNLVLHAMADIQERKIEAGLSEIRNSLKDDARIAVPKERRFVGLDAYKQLLASGVDLVVLATPPGFRPLHF